MKITLNTTSIPENRRPEVEALATSFAQNTTIIWLPSRFPRFVMLVEPGTEDKSEADRGSIFEAADEGIHSLAALTEILEERIKTCLAGPIGAVRGAVPPGKAPAKRAAASLFQ